MPNTDQTPAGLNLIVIQFYSFLKNCANFLKCTFVRVTVLTCSVLLFFSLPDIVRMMVRSMFNVVYWIIVIHSMCWNDRTWHTSVVLHHNVPSFVKGATSRWYCSFGQQFCANVITSFLYPNTQKNARVYRRRILSAEILASNKSAFPGAPIDSFLLDMLKTLFRLCRVLLGPVYMEVGDPR